MSHLNLHLPACPEGVEEALNLFLDGELPMEAQSPLFAHLAHCQPCRYRLDVVLRFRRMSRQETLAVPPVVDEAFLQRLARLKARKRASEREASRKRLSPMHVAVPLYLTLVFVILMFFVGMYVQALQVMSPPAQVVPVVNTPPPVVREPLYLIYPGPTVEAERGDVPARRQGG
jgi:anti-sigma factor RsiW